VEVVPGGVDLARFQPPVDRAAIRRHWGLTPEDFLFLAVRRLDPRMGLELLVEAFAEVAERHPRARLWMTGRGPAEPMLRERIARLHLEERVRLLGFLPEPDLPGLLGAADVTLMPSLDLEGFGLATAESLACGTPVLGSRAGATPELLEPLDPGLLFEPGSRPALARHLETVLARPASLPARDRCAAHARARFPWSAQVDAAERAARELARPLHPPA
jgi:glycosyltransferase involved in cell wall biosynthesis